MGWVQDRVSPASDASMTLPDEPISLSAPLARRLAAQFCRRDPVSGDQCSWYHGLWQDLRSIGLAASPEHQAEFFLGAFQQVSKRRGRQRILISGAADYSILAYVLWACREHAVDAEVTVIDRCNTPLFLNTWYAERVGCQVATVCTDILQYQAEMPFDVVCSHSFLGQFAQDLRPGLIDKWSRLLRPGGIVLAVNRVRSADGPKEVGFSPEETRLFCATVAKRIGRWPALAPQEREEILRRTGVYVERSRTFAISTMEMAELFERNAFAIDHISSIISTNPRNQVITGKAIPKDANHACLVARKRTPGGPP